MQYQMQGKCEKCGKEAMCLWVVTGFFNGVLQCRQCVYLTDDDIADAIKAMDLIQRKSEQEKSVKGVGETD